MLLRFLVFPGIFKEMMFYQVVGRKVQEGETINHDIGEEIQHNKRETISSSPYLRYSRTNKNTYIYKKKSTHNI